MMKSCYTKLNNASFKVNVNHTVTVTRKIAEALDVANGEEKRCGEWGFYIGNMWAKTRKEVNQLALEMLEIGAGKPDWKEILRKAVKPHGYDIHGKDIPMFIEK